MLFPSQIYIKFFFSNSFLKSQRRYLLFKSSASGLLLDPGCPFLSLLGGEETLPVTNLATNKLALFICPLHFIFMPIGRQAKSTYLSFPEKVPCRLNLHPHHRVCIGVGLHALKLDVVHKGVHVRGGERMVEKVAQVFQDLPLVPLHVLEPKELHIFFVSYVPPREDVIPIVSIGLGTMSNIHSLFLLKHIHTCIPNLKSSANCAKSPTNPDSGSLIILK